jgi:hypothetical protein
MPHVIVTTCPPKNDAGALIRNCGKQQYGRVDIAIAI